LYRQGSYDKLLEYVASVETKDALTNREEIKLLAAEAYFNSGDYEHALGGYVPYIELKKYAVSNSILLNAGYSAYQLGNVDQALDFLRRSASDKDSVGFYSSYYLGSIYLKKNQKPLAQVAFDNARHFKSDPAVVEEATFQYAKISYELGQPDKAIGEFEMFMSMFPSSAHATEVKELLSQAYVNANNYNKAIEYIESMPTRGPAIDLAYQKATLLKGIELFNMDAYAQAVQYFEKSLQVPVDQEFTAEASFWCGEAYSIGRKYEEAAEKYVMVIGLVGYSNTEILVKTRYGLGYAYYNQQDYERALFNFKEFVNKGGTSNPNYGDGVIRLADCYYVTKSYNEALGFYRRALQIKTAENDYAHLQAGVILGIQRKYAEAAGELNQVINNYPQSRFIDEAMFQRAQLEFEQGNYAASVAGFSKLIETGKPSRFIPYAHLRRAASYYNLKDYNKTAADYITIVDKYSSHPIADDALLPLQESLTLAGRGAEFDRYLAEYKAANPEAKGIESVEFETAKNLHFNQEYQKAIDQLGRYTASYPESPRITEARYYRAESYYRLKDYNQALAIYNEISTDNTFAFASRVVGRIAELEFRLGNFSKAITQYHELSITATTKKDQFNAWSGLMRSHYLLAQYDSSDVYAGLILEKGNVNAGAQNMASLYLGKSAMARGDYEAAKDEFINTLNTARDEYGAEAKYLLAEIFYLTKDHKQCYETVVSLIKDFAAYPEWVGKSYLLLADSYVAIGDLFQAKGTLRSLESFPLESIKSLAAEKLRKIEMQESQAPADTTLRNNEK
jgi:TolA-binding protein